MEKVFDYIERDRDVFLKDLFDLVRIPSVSPLPSYAEQIQEGAAFVAKIMEKCGLAASVYQTNGNPVVYGQSEQVSGRPTVLIYGHYDVQPEGDRAAWDSDPYEAVIRNGRVYGRGVGDNKGQILAHIEAYKAYCAVKGAPKINIKYLVEGEEEVGSINLAPFVEAHKEMLKADITIWSDGNIHVSGRPLITLGMKGLNPIKITVKGPEADVHSQWASVLPNPVWGLVKILSSLKDENGRVNIPGFYDDLIGPGELEKTAIQKIPSDIRPFADIWNSPAFDGKMDSVEFFSKYMYEPTINIGCITAGNVDGVKNIVPHEASCWIDMRLGPKQNSQKKRDDFCKYVQMQGVPGVEISIHGSDAAMTPLTNPFVEPVVDIIREIWGEEPIVYPGIGGSGPFPVFNNILEAPCMMVPFADAQQNDHSPNESIPVENLMLGAKIAATMMNRFAEIAF